MSMDRRLDRRWTVQDSAELYHIPAWGSPYFGVNEKGNLTGMHIRVSGQSINAFVAPGTIADGKAYAMYRTLTGVESGQIYSTLPGTAGNVLVSSAASAIPGGPVWQDFSIALLDHDSMAALFDRTDPDPEHGDGSGVQSLSSAARGPTAAWPRLETLNGARTRFM